MKILFYNVFKSLVSIVDSVQDCVLKEEAVENMFSKDGRNQCLYLKPTWYWKKKSHKLPPTSNLIIFSLNFKGGCDTDILKYNGLVCNRIHHLLQFFGNVYKSVSFNSLPRTACFIRFLAHELLQKINNYKQFYNENKLFKMFSKIQISDELCLKSIHWHTFILFCLRKISISIKTYQLNFCVLIWFICAFHPETSSFLH